MVSDDELFERRRRQMVREQLEDRDIEDRDVLDALGIVPREAFVPEDYRSMAYSDRPLPIGKGQTISQPYIVALMTQMAELDGDDRVLEIGTGSGYGVAVASRIADEVYTLERHPELAESARASLEEVGYDNVEVILGDGTKGLPDRAPFDAIIATASGPDVPDSLKEQLAVGGRLVMPVGGKTGGQRLVGVRRIDEASYDEEDMGFVRFVPLIGEEGWSEGEAT